MKRTGVLLAGILALAYGQQWSIAGNNEMRFGQGREGYRYLENLAALNLYYTDYHFYLQYEYSDPPEMGLAFRGIRKRWMEYSGGSVAVRIGHQQTLWNRGLVLNLFDDQLTDYDNTIDGFRIQYQPFGWLGNELLGGRGQIRNVYSDIQSRRPNREEDFRLFGARTQLVRLFERVDLGAAYVWSLTHSPFHLQTFNPAPVDIFDTLKTEQRALGLNLHFSNSWLDVYFENCQRSVNNKPQKYYFSNFGMSDSLQFDRRRMSGGFYGSVSASLPFVSVILDYKRYAFDVINPERRRNPEYRPGRLAPFQKPPIVHKEHEWTLASRYLHVIDFDDEIGYQVEIQSSPLDFLSIVANYSAASRLVAWPDTSTTWVSAYQKIDVDGFLPSGKENYMPFEEAIFGAEGELAGFWYRLFYIQSREIKEYYRSTNPNNFTQRTVERQSVRTLPVELEYAFGRHAATLHCEFQNYRFEQVSQTRFAKNTFGQETYNRQVLLGYSLAPLVSINLIEEISSHRDPNAGNRRRWEGVEIVANVHPNHQLRLFAGSERGGLRCANGICAPVPSIIKGVRLTVNSRF